MKNCIGTLLYLPLQIELTEDDATRRRLAQKPVVRKQAKPLGKTIPTALVKPQRTEPPVDKNAA
jgi:hypothetical protein